MLERVEPRRDLEERDLSLSSYQFDALVASSEALSALGRSEDAAEEEFGSCGLSTVVAEDAVTAPFCLRRLIRWPCSFSDDV